VKIFKEGLWISCLNYCEGLRSFLLW